MAVTIFWIALVVGVVGWMLNLRWYQETGKSYWISQVGLLMALFGFSTAGSILLVSIDTVLARM